MAMGREVRGEDILGRLASGISSVALASRGGGGEEDLVGLAARVDYDGAAGWRLMSSWAIRESSVVGEIGCHVKYHAKA